jgi:hypothetical protein
MHLAARGGKQAKGKAVVAVARKLAVLLHRIWVKHESYIRLTGISNTCWWKLKLAPRQCYELAMAHEKEMEKGTVTGPALP